jgi:hypothetical protein
MELHDYTCLVIGKNSQDGRFAIMQLEYFFTQESVLCRVFHAVGPS